MSEPDGIKGPRTGDTRFAEDGTLEAFDGHAWTPYRPPHDDGYGMILKVLEPSSDD